MVLQNHVSSGHKLVLFDSSLLASLGPRVHRARTGLPKVQAQDAWAFAAALAFAAAAPLALRPSCDA